MDVLSKMSKRGVPKDDRAYDDNDDDGVSEAPQNEAQQDLKRPRIEAPAAEESDTEETTNEEPNAAAAAADTTTNADAIALFSDGLITTVIFSFLGIKQLLKVSSTSQFLRSHITHEHVVRAALCNGGRPKATMERLVTLVRSRTIWTPTPLRLLRLVNGKRCERCNGTSNRGSVHLVSQFGVFMCGRGCLRNHLHPIRRNRDDRWDQFINHARIAATEDTSLGGGRTCYNVASEDCYDTDGSRVGAMFTKATMDRGAVCFETKRTYGSLRMRPGCGKTNNCD